MERWGLGPRPTQRTSRQSFWDGLFNIPARYGNAKYLVFEAFDRFGHAVAGAESEMPQMRAQPVGHRREDPSRVLPNCGKRSPFRFSCPVAAFPPTLVYNICTPAVSHFCVPVTRQTHSDSGDRMSISFACPSCGKAYRLKDELAGKTARCVCGKQIKVPTPSPPPAPEPAADLANLLDEFEAPTTKARLNRAPPTIGNFGIEQSNTLVRGHGVLSPFSTWLENSGSSVVKIAIGAIVGSLCGWTAIAQDKGAPAMALSLQIGIVACTAIVGAGAASLLIVADIVGARVKEGRSVPRILRWYFAARWLSLFLWIATVFAGAIVWAFIFAAMQ